jgi:predicted nicotinamide N-methyase
MNTKLYEIDGTPISIHSPEVRTLHMSSYWSYQWGCGKVLAEELITHSGEGKTLLELGPGLGLCTVVSSMAGYSVTAVDSEEGSLNYTTMNCTANMVKQPITVHKPWKLFLHSNRMIYNTIIGADILYDINQVSTLISIFSTSLAYGGTVYIADASRSPKRIYHKFTEELELRGFHFVEDAKVANMEQDAPHTYDILEDIRLLTITRKTR